MSLTGAMMTGVAGLNAYSNALSVTSANIANVNTYGYKTATSDFSTLLASSTGSNDASSASVVSTSGQNVSVQGLFESTSSDTDLAISGNGFFVVSDSATDSDSLAYTRSGSFSTDADGYLVNSSGYYLQGWALDSDGNVPSDANDLTAINLDNLTSKAEATTDVSASINLQSSTEADTTYDMGASVSVASGDVTADFQSTINVYDSQGGTQALQLSFVKTDANTWAYEVSYTGDSSNLTTASASEPNLIASGTVTFNTDGTLASVTPTGGTASTTGEIDITIPWDSTTSGLDSQTISLNLGTLDSSAGLTQYDNTSSMSSSKVDGALLGSLSGVSISSDGTVTAEYSNGLSQDVYKIPLATFSNPDGLTQISGNAYKTSTESGSPTISEADSGGAGTIEASNLEESTVDLATEFTDLITTQRAYSAASKIVTTASTMYDDLLNMVR